MFNGYINDHDDVRKVWKKMLWDDKRTTPQSMSASLSHPYTHTHTHTHTHCEQENSFAVMTLHEIITKTSVVWACLKGI